MKKYKLITTVSSLNSKINTYGIKCTADLCVIRDISTNKDIVLKMCDAFNRYDLSEIHFKDAVEDFLADCYS